MKTQIIAKFCLLLCAFSAVAHADVCQKDDNKVRVQVVKLKDGSIIFLDGTAKNASKLGPDTTYTTEELRQKYLDARSTIDKVDINDTGNAVMLLFAALAISSDPNGRAIVANHPGPSLSDTPEARAKLPRAKQVADALNTLRVSPSKDCLAYVDSVDAYKTELASVLAEVNSNRADKPAAQPPAPTVADTGGIKTIVYTDATSIHRKSQHPESHQSPAN